HVEMHILGLASLMVVPTPFRAVWAQDINTISLSAAACPLQRQTSVGRLWHLRPHFLPPPSPPLRRQPSPTPPPPPTTRDSPRPVTNTRPPPCCSTVRRSLTPAPHTRPPRQRHGPPPRPPFLLCLPRHLRTCGTTLCIRSTDDQCGHTCRAHVHPDAQYPAQATFARTLTVEAKPRPVPCSAFAARLSRPQRPLPASRCTHHAACWTLQSWHPTRRHPCLRTRSNPPYPFPIARGDVDAPLFVLDFPSPLQPPHTRYMPRQIHAQYPSRPCLNPTMQNPKPNLYTFSELRASPRPCLGLGYDTCRHLQCTATRSTRTALCYRGCGVCLHALVPFADAHMLPFCAVPFVCARLPHRERPLFVHKVLSSL
ncbi:hypothetical protein B0H14DRAFT_2696481, partial [Mycena olivaceomarginata]